MLGTWFRCKYPHLVDGVIAGSGGPSLQALVQLCGCPTIQGSKGMHTLGTGVLLSAQTGAATRVADQVTCAQHRGLGIQARCHQPGRIPYVCTQSPALRGAAPIWTYRGERPAYDDGSFAKIVTRDASAEGGSAPACAANVREAWKALMHLGKTGGEGRSTGWRVHTRRDLAARRHGAGYVLGRPFCWV